MNEYYQHALILVAVAILIVVIKNFNVVRVPPNYYILCPDGTIVGGDAHFCANRQGLECEGRICEVSRQSPYYKFYR